MSDHFSLDWGKPQPQPDRVEPSQPLDDETLARLEAYAETVLLVRPAVSMPTNRLAL